MSKLSAVRTKGSASNSLRKTTVGEYEAGLEEFRRRDFKSAAEVWLRAANHATEEDAIKIADGLSGIAVVLGREGGSEHSYYLRLVERALELRRAFLKANDKSIGMELNNLGMLYDYLNEPSKQLALLEQAVAILDQYDNLDEYRHSMPYDNLAVALFEREKFALAQTMCKKGLEIRDRLLGRINPLSISSLELLADIEAELNPHARATRETRKEFEQRLKLLAKELESKGDSFLSEALFLARENKDNAEEIIHTALGLQCGEFLSGGSMTLPSEFTSPEFESDSKTNNSKERSSAASAAKELSEESRAASAKSDTGPCPRCVYVEHFNKDGAFAAMMEFQHDRPEFMRGMAIILDWLFELEEPKEGVGIRIKRRKMKAFFKTGLCLLGFPDVADVFEKDTAEAKRLFKSRLRKLKNWKPNKDKSETKNEKPITDALIAWQKLAHELCDLLPNGLKV